MSLLKGSFNTVIRGPVSSPTTNTPVGADLSSSHVSGYNPSSSLFPDSSSQEAGRKGKSPRSSTPLGALREVQDLKEQLEALQCQVGCSLQHSVKKCLPFLM